MPSFLSFLVIAALAFAGCSSGDQAPLRPEGKGNCASFDELRQPFFGETHVHTDRSLDANTQATRLTPNDAYAFARGATIGIQPYDDEGNSLRSLTIDAPLDFVMVSDHAEYLGVIRSCEDPEREGYDQPECEQFRDDPGARVDLPDLVQALSEMHGAPLCGRCTASSSACRLD